MLLPEAATPGRLDVVHACLAAGFPIDTTDRSGATALHHAALHGHAATVHELLARGADIRIEDPGTTRPRSAGRLRPRVSIDPDGDYAATIGALSADTPPARRRRR